MFKIFLVTIIAFLASAAALDVQESTDMDFFRESPDAVALMVSKMTVAGQSTKCRICAPPASTSAALGAYAVVSTMPGSSCVDPNPSMTAYKADTCMMISDKGWHNRYRLKATCDLTTGEVTVSTHSTTDTNCASPTTTMTLQKDQCMDGMAASCHADMSFLHAWNRHAAEFYYSDMQAAETNMLSSANVMTMGNKLPQMYNYDGVNPTPRGPCFSYIVPGFCVDTTNVRSFAYFATNFTHASVNLYQRFQGKGSVNVTEYKDVVYNSDDMTLFSATRYLVKGWYQEYVSNGL